MSKSEGPAITPEMILAHLDGEAVPGVGEALRDDPEAAALAAGYDRLQRRLTGALYRHDCPPAQALGEYALDLAGTADRVAIAAHVGDCPRCADELAQIRAFLAIETDPPAPGPLERARRLVATLVAAPPVGVGAALRGDDAETARTYRAGENTITIDQFATGRRGYRSLVGLLDRPAPVPADALASLRAADGTRREEPIDATGNFAFDDLTTGAYQLEVRLGGDLVVVDELLVGD